METTEALFGPVVETEQQWRLETLLLCNWGGFGGVHEIEFDRASTLLSGASGAGKSTVLDAWTTLLTPNLPLNTASNEAGARSRGEGARTTLTYVRGQYDRIERDEVMVPLVLRGDGQDTWSLVAAVFASTSGRRYTFLRAFHAPRDAAAPGDMKAVFCAFDGRLRSEHVSNVFQAAAENAFRKDALEKLAGLQVLTSSVYSEQLQRTLGIGAHGDGAKALRLLYDLQRGKPVDRVSKLFRDMVLERPATFDKADKVIASFDSLDAMHREMEQAEAQLAVLDGMNVDRQLIVDSQSEMERIDVLGVDRQQRSPYRLWVTRYEEGLFDDEIELLGEQQRAADEESKQWQRRADELKGERDTLERRWRDEGGDAIAATDEEIRRLTAALADVREARAQYASDTAVLGGDLPITFEQFTQSQEQSRRFQGRYAHEVERLRQQTLNASEPYFAAKASLRDAEEELAHLRVHAGNIPRPMHQIRVAWADALGVPEQELPFAGELIDMHGDYESWRVAADAVLGGLATTVLVDERLRPALRVAINEQRLSLRVRYRGVTVNQPVPGPAAAGNLAGRVVVKEGPFAGWLRRHVNDEFAYDCVENAAELRDDGVRRVTRNGQTQEGRRGAHGGNTNRRIGFSNAERQLELHGLVDTLTATINGYDETLRGFEQQRRVLDETHAAHKQVLRVAWTDIDTATVENGLQQQQEVRANLLAASDVLDILTAQMERFDGERQTAQKRAWRCDSDARGYETRTATLDQQRETLRSTRAALEQDDAVILTDQQINDLDTEFGRTDWNGELSGFHLAETLLRERLTAVMREARQRVEAASQRLVNRFERFDQSWPDNNRDATLTSYDDYLAILTNLRDEGLAAQRRNWARSVIEWSGEDLSDLVQSYNRARHDIDERLRPIRRILATIPFGRGDTTLDVRITHRSPEPVRAFMEQLRALASGTMSPDATDDAVRGKFELIRGVVARVRTGNKDERNMLLEVRQHLDAKASVITDGIPGRVYDHLGDKSGGESQMLTAFIVGAALRYHLGDEDRNRPRFAPVVLDEAFIKADGEYTARAVVAWQQLGFQLVVGAPEDKFNALEPSMGLVIGVTKNRDEYSYATPTPRLTE